MANSQPLNVLRTFLHATCFGVIPYSFFIAEGQARSKWNWEVYLPERSVQISFTSELTLSETYN